MLYNYVIEQMVYNLKTTIDVRGPSFANANLRQAQFGQHLLFGLVKDNYGHHYVEGVDFRRADLANADFGTACFFAIDDGQSR